MRIAIVFVVAGFGTAYATTPVDNAEPPFAGGWERCESYRDASVCAWIAMA